MTRHEVRLPAKRLRLFGIFCGSALGLLVAYVMLQVMFASIAHDQSFIEMAFPLLVIACGIVCIFYFALFAVWAFARLVFNLPAVVLTPEGIVNHSKVYRVVVPWGEIDHFSRDLNVASTSAARKLGRRGDLADSDIIILEHDERRLYEQQQLLTRALLRIFKALRPMNISTDVMAETPEEVWVQLERYVHETVGDTRIKFLTFGPKSTTRA